MVPQGKWRKFNTKCDEKKENSRKRFTNEIRNSSCITIYSKYYFSYYNPDGE